MKSANKLYQYHVANLKEVDRAMDRIAKSLSLAISTNDEISESAFKRLYALLLAAWAECRLNKLIYEPKGFDDKERSEIRGQSTQLVRWQRAVELAFRSQYKIPKANLSAPGVLHHSANSRYITLHNMLDNDLGLVIELRNKLAHGQWIYPLNSSGDDIAQEQMDALRIENLLSLRFKKTLLETLSSTIHDLVVSRPTFERDFDKHYQKIIEIQRNLRNRDYGKWVEMMQNKYQQGKSKKSLLNHRLIKSSQALQME